MNGVDRADGWIKCLWVVMVQIRMCRFREIFRRAVVVEIGSQSIFGPTIIRGSVQENVLDHYFLERSFL